MNLTETLRLHKLWLSRDPSGVRANLIGANLEGANLPGANLEGANLEGANLEGANLLRANLPGANLEGANLLGANLGGANLEGANLPGANLEGANLLGANLLGANLRVANLEGANLLGANLEGANLLRANLPGANLEGANLLGANLGGANLKGVVGFPYVPVVQNIDQAILDLLKKGMSLDMSTYHSCETTHCRAGFAILLAGDKGKALERATSSYLAGRLIYEASRPGIPCPDFFCHDDEALADIQHCACVYTKGG